jgi:hypothetical protein
MSHGIVTPITHAPSTLDYVNFPRRGHIGGGVRRVKGNRYGPQRSLDAVDIQIEDNDIPASKITISISNLEKPLLPRAETP